MKPYPLLLMFLSLFLLWTMLSAHLDPLLLTLGFFSALFVLWLAVYFGITKQHTHFPGLYLRLPVFAFWLAKRMVISSLQVALIILRPRLKINPKFVPVKMVRCGDLALTIHANSITLTPGTVTTDITGHDGEVHVLSHSMNTQRDFDQLEKKMLFLEGDAS